MTAKFLQFAASQADLLIALFERTEVDEADLSALIERHRTEEAPTTAHIRRQLEEFGIIERSAAAETAFELSLPMRELFEWLTRRQRLSSATVLRGYLDDLRERGTELEQAIRAGDASLAMLALKEIDKTIDRLRGLSNANRESTLSEAGAMRSAGPNLTAYARFQTVARLWTRFLEPLRQLVDVKGEMEQRVEHLRTQLDEGERRFTTHGDAHRGFARAIARLTRLRMAAFADHHASIAEVAPLYNRMRRETRWVLGASSALRQIRDKGINALSLDQRLGIVGWRTGNLMSDVNLRARIASLVGYQPMLPAHVVDVPPPPPQAFISRVELHRELQRAAPIDDVLAFLLNRWPDLPLRTQLRAYGQIVSGKFGPVESGEPNAEKSYDSRAGKIRAWPLKLPRVVP